MSLVLFVVALRGLGSARTGAYFSTAPFIGASIAIGAFYEPTSLTFWVAAALMAAGVWLHLTERHEHEHEHELLDHTHTVNDTIHTTITATNSTGMDANRTHMRIGTSGCGTPTRTTPTSITSMGIDP